MRRRPRNAGFTLVEAILATVIIAASFMGMVYALSTATLGNRSLTNINTAVLLARDFSAIAIGTTGPTSYGGNFAAYRYQIDVGYVQAADLNTVVTPGPTDYKRIVVTVTRTGWTGSIRLISLKTNV